jgi:hypothetical protein
VRRLPLGSARPAARTPSYPVSGKVINIKKITEHVIA